MKPTILIVDDDEEIRTQMKWALGGDYELRMAGDRTGGDRSISEGASDFDVTRPRAAAPA